jgi:hypothetical protein
VTVWKQEGRKEGRNMAEKMDKKISAKSTLSRFKVW